MISFMVLLGCGVVGVGVEAPNGAFSVYYSSPVEDKDKSQLVGGSSLEQS
jgi:hypothetical protein